MNIKPTETEAIERILLIGTDLPTLRPNSGTERPQIVRQNSVVEAIAEMRRTHFDRVVVPFSALEHRTEPALTGLRQADPSTEIILLAKMLEEPFILEMMERTRFRSQLFDDYLICPPRCEDITGIRREHNVSAPSRLTDAEKDRRIEELERLVIQDDLTGLKNRRYMHQFLPQVLELARQHHLRVTLLVFDIDDFKHYNDAYGHAVGDNVLRQAARMIRHCCRNHDVVARLGGDEFAVVFWDLPASRQSNFIDSQSHRDRRAAALEHPREPIFMAERFCHELEQASFEFIGPKGKGALTISGGLATFPADAGTSEELLEKADLAMLEAKRSGKNRLYLVGRPTTE